MNRSRTKLVCTIGPASAERVGDLVAAGMDVARINFSHGTPDDHRAYVHAVRAAAHSARRSVAVMVDLPGPKIRLGELENGAVTLESGATFTLRPETRADADAPNSVTTAAATNGTATDAASESTATADPTADAATAPTAMTDPTADGVAAPGAGDTTLEPMSGGDPPKVSDDFDDTAGSAMTVDELAAAPDALGDASGATVSTPGLSAQLQVGDRVLLADGAAELRVTAVSASAIETDVVQGGTIRSRSGVNIPSSRLTDEGLTEDDRTAIPRALELRADLIAQSFVRAADDVRALRSMLPIDGPRVVAKIETRAAIDNFDDIAQLADGIMVARGDLGVDIPFEEVPLVQKDLIRRAAAADRFSIVATQMLESMTTASRPTRAEASDVANAVLDGADAVMLSAETAIGAHPVEALQAMARICFATEREPGVDSVPARENEGTSPRPGEPMPPATAIILAAAASTGLTAVDAIWCFTRTGHTAEKLSMTRPEVPIVAFTLSPIVARRLAVRRGVIPMILPTAGRGEPLIDRMEGAWRSQRDRSNFDTVVLVTTSQRPTGINRFEVHRLSGRVAPGH